MSPTSTARSEPVDGLTPPPTPCATAWHRAPRRDLLVGFRQCGLHSFREAGPRPPNLRWPQFASRTGGQPMANILGKGRTALVTGASRGIGPLIARQIASEGGHVVLTGRSAADLA